jgi:hypothetical protein
MHTTYIVISAEKSNLSTLENIERTAEMESCLQFFSFTYRRAVGRYRGVEESSFLIPVETYAQVHRLRSLGAEFDQESILEIKQGHGWLLNTDGDSEEYLGTVYEATGREDAYTQVGSKLFTFWREA